MFKVTTRAKAGGNSPAFSMGNMTVDYPKVQKASFGELDAVDLDDLPKPRQTANGSDGYFRVSDARDADDPLLNNLSAKIRREMTKRYVEGSRAQYPSAKQVGYLGYLLDNPGRAGMDAFVRFANGYYMGEITRQHFVQAINLCLRGRNEWGTAEQLVAVSFGAEFEAELTPTKPRLSRGKARNSA